MTASVRRKGFYWVKRPSGSKEFVAEWNGSAFWGERYRDDLIVLSDRLMAPGERSPDMLPAIEAPKGG